MNLKEKLKNVGSYSLTILIMIGIGFVFALFFKGAVWVSGVINAISGYLFLVVTAIFVLSLPLSIFLKTRALAATIMYIISYIYGAILWTWSFLITFFKWGVIGVIIGLIIAGVGVFPIAIIANIVDNDWRVIFHMIILLVLTYGLRMFSGFLAEKCRTDNDYEELNF